MRLVLPTRWRQRRLSMGALGALGALAVALAFPAAAQSGDIDALLLADAPAAPTVAARDWQLFSELAAGQVHTLLGRDRDNQRVSLDLQIDHSLAPGWRAVLADRLDVSWPPQGGQEHPINTLNEAWVGWQASDTQAVDLGRINARFGVATGYSPTDYFRTGSIRSVVSVDPGSLKKNRQGAFMLRSQAVWDQGALTALLSPRLAAQPSSAPFALNEGATNASNRWLLAWSQRLNDQFNPQWLLYGEERQAPQTGFNLATLVNDSTVAFAEWSGGRSRSQLAQALDLPEDRSFHQRLSAGATWTAASKLSLTLEYSRNNTALSAPAWRALQNSASIGYAMYRNWTITAQEMATHNMYAVYAHWPDVLVPHLELNAMVRANAADHSQLHWLELRYHWSQIDLAMQWQGSKGSARSEFGAVPHAWELSVRKYF
ncbi:hypothetical protein [Simplicispira hankyongi]|nr:hypothetical protein [Simplicispira hankyongi]